jgi:hypothetical protein
MKAANLFVTICAAISGAAAIPAPADWHAAVRDLAAKHFKNPAWGNSHCKRDWPPRIT